MLTVEQLDTRDRKQVRRFIEIPFRLYANCPQWVPPIRVDQAAQLNKNKHPYYEHSDGDFFIAVQDGIDVGRLAVFENQRYNAYHQKKQAHFYFFEAQQDLSIARSLFERASAWAKDRGLNTLVGPKGLGPLDGYGLLVEGFEHRQMMTMMNYNFAYYPEFLEKLGFSKEVDFVSCYINTDQFKLPDRVYRIAERAMQRSGLSVLEFKNKKELQAWAPRIGKAYNQAFIHNWEYYPLTQHEIDFVVGNILTIANPKLIKIISHGEDVVGFLFGFQDVSAALQRSKGRLLPFGLLDLLLELRRTDWISLNGAGILPEFQGRGGNALLYAEMVKTVQNKDFHFEHAEMTQVAETAETMRADLINLGGKPYKNHRVYRKEL